MSANAKLDLSRLRPTQLIRVVNSTPLGGVLTRARLRRQVEQAGFRLGDGKEFHFMRYVAWLASEVHRPQRGAAERYEEHRKKMAERIRMQTLASQDVGVLPDVVDMKRRTAACKSLRMFYETYFPQVFFIPWSPDHLRVIDRMERCISGGGLFAFAMPRGTGKTTMACLAALWAVLTGQCSFVCLIGASRARAQELLKVIRKVFISPDYQTLRDDFPEALFPLARLRDSARKQSGQHIAGMLTHCVLGKDRIVFPTVLNEQLPQALRSLKQAPACSAIISVTSLDSNMRGQQHVRHDGSIVRPSIVLLDDPQTRESARSPVQTKYRLDLIQGDVLGMAGPGEKIAAFLTCTKLYESDLADQLLDSQLHPEWQGISTRLLVHEPANKKMWDEYQRIRSDSLRLGNEGREATEFYAQHRVAMDAGAAVSWESRHYEDELSAIQHAMNIRYRIGADAFNAEYQNEPVARQETDIEIIAPGEMIKRVNGRPQKQVPMACTRVTAFVDLHDDLHYYCVCAWEPNFTGYVIDYGTFPEQGRNYFTQRKAAHTLGQQFPGAGLDGAIQAGLEALASRLLQASWKKSGGGVLRISRLFVDMGYKKKLAAAIKFKCGGETMMLARGIGFRAGSKPISMYQRRPGWTLGENWYIPKVSDTSEFPHICVDVNSWKTFVHERLGITVGDPGSLTLFGNDPYRHRLFADHVCASEIYVVTFGQGRQVHEWRALPGHPDNHWFDCLVGCAAAASLEGVALPGLAPAAMRPTRKRYTQADMKRRRLGLRR